MLRSVYPVTIEIMEWMNHTLVPIEEPVFNHYRGIHHLVRVVDRAAAGHIPEYAAFEQIEDHNQEYGTSLTYEEILTRSSTYIFHDLGQWAAYVDDLNAQNSILSGNFDDPDEVFSNAAPDINWIVLLLTSDEVVVVYRSPHIGYRECYDAEHNLAEGISEGTLPAYTLHPQLEAALGWLDPAEIIQQQRSCHAR